LIDRDKPVRVFKNWKHDCYSIMQHGKLLASAKQVRLAGVEFRVRESGRQRMLREQRKNVHAFATGELLDYVHPHESRNLEKPVGRNVYYDPYAFPTFVDFETQSPVRSADLVHFDEDGVIYNG